MTQAVTWSVPVVGPATPNVMAQRIDDSLDALLSGHSGSSRPPYAVAGTVWEDTSVGGTVTVNFYDGSNDIALWSVNTSTNVVTFSNVTPASNQTFSQCQLALVAGNLVLSRKNGRLLTINGAAEVIPASGPTLAATGLTPSSLYYIYAYMNSGTMTLEASATAYTIDATTGIAIKTGDVTRTLVGMARPVTGPAWSDTPKQRFVRSWFNDPGVSLLNNFTANRLTTSTTTVELNSEIRCEALIWSGEDFKADSSGTIINGTSNGQNRSMIGFDGTTPEPCGSTSVLTNTDTVPFHCHALKTGLSEGYHYATLLGSVASGSGAWYGDLDTRRTTLAGRTSR